MSRSVIFSQCCLAVSIFCKVKKVLKFQNVGLFVYVYKCCLKALETERLELAFKHFEVLVLQ